MVGQNIGKYRVLDRIGRGGMGTVYRAIDETLHRDVAIKVLNAELNDPEVAKRFRAEAITVARLSHPGIATIYELFQHEGQWLMVMEFVRGETLEHMVERMGPLSPQRAAELCMQTLAALAHAHSMGVVHRDLKPANLMITEVGAIKIMDFGIARVSGTEHLTSAGFMMGTPAYMAPEQVMGREIDARADLYALGVVFFRLTTAKLPFKGDTPFAMAQSQVNDPPTPIGMFRTDLPAWVEPAVAKALAKAPEQRFQSAIEFHEAFARCLAGLPMTATYSSSAPTELMMTPPRAMPTGALYRTPTPVPTSYPAPMPAPAATGSQAAAPSPAASFDPGLAPTMLSGPQDQSPAPPAPVATPLATAAIAAAAPDAAPVGATTSSPADVTSTGSQAAPVVSTGAQGAPVMATGATPAAPPSVSATGTAPALSTPGATAGASPAASVAATTSSSAQTKKQKAASNVLLAGLAAGAVILLLIGGGGAWYWRRHHPPQAATTTADATPAPAAEPSAAASTETPSPDLGAAGATPPSDATAAPGAAGSATTPSDSTGARATTSPATAPGAGRGAAAGTSGPGGTASTSVAAPGRSAADAGAGAAPASRGTGRGDASHAGAAPSFDDTHEVYQNIRLLVVNGKRATDREAILSFGNGQISLAGGEGGTALMSVPYKAVAHLTYVHGRDPKWSDAESASAPPKDLDVGSFMRTAKHWLVLQTADRFVILRLDDKNVRQVLDTVGTRTGVTIDRPQSNDKDQ